MDREQKNVFDVYVLPFAEDRVMERVLTNTKPIQNPRKQDSRKAKRDKVHKLKDTLVLGELRGFQDKLLSPKISTRRHDAKETPKT